jgi:hypothetical protein
LQVAAPLSEHCPRGSWPDGTLVHEPALPVSAQDVQLPVQAVRQHAPCAQIPDLQSVPAPQLAPGGLSPQLPETQKLPLVQSASAEQVVLQAPVDPQVQGAQDWLAAAGHGAPVPSQRPAKLSVDPAQPACWQTTPAA